MCMEARFRHIKKKVCLIATLFLGIPTLFLAVLTISRNSDYFSQFWQFLAILTISRNSNFISRNSNFISRNSELFSPESSESDEGTSEEDDEVAIHEKGQDGGMSSSSNSEDSSGSEDEAEAEAHQNKRANKRAKYIGGQYDKIAKYLTHKLFVVVWLHILNCTVCIIVMCVGL